MKTIDQLMEDAVADGVFPAAELLVAKHGEVRHHQHYGDASNGTLFDIASLTKSIATATRVMQLVSHHALSLDEPLKLHLPESINGPYASVSLRDVLTHTAGFPAWKAYYQAVDSERLRTPYALHAITTQVLAEPQAIPPRTQGCYSDLGYIALGALLEKVDGRGLEEQFAQEIAQPLEMRHTFFMPLHESRMQARAAHECAFAPTEHCAWRGALVQGTVHDQNCHAMGGVAGHAGLFSNAEDIHTFIHQFVSCYRGHSDWIHQEIIANFLCHTHIEAIAGATHLCGWDTPGLAHSQAGTHFSRNSIGHLGYTGCSMWIDLDQDWWIILLTNRVHPTTENEKIKTFRPALHDAIYDAFIVG